MTTKFAVLLCLAPFFVTGNLNAQEHKAEVKADPKEEPKKDSKPAAAKPDSKPAEGQAKKQEAKPEPLQEKPSAVAAEHAAPRAPLARRAPSRLQVRTAPRAIHPRAAVAVASVAKPAAPLPLVVEVRQEPARIEAILHVVPYGAPSPGIAPFAGSGYASSPYNAPSYSVSASPVPQATTATEPLEAVPGEAQVGSFAPASFAAPAAAPLRNTLRVPRNALTNEGLVTLAQVGYDEDFILELMRLKNCRFDTSVEGLAYMATNGLTERIVKAALKADAANQLAAQLEARR